MRVFKTEFEEQERLAFESQFAKVNTVVPNEELLEPTLEHPVHAHIRRRAYSSPTTEDNLLKDDAPSDQSKERQPSSSSHHHNPEKKKKKHRHLDKKEKVKLNPSEKEQRKKERKEAKRKLRQQEQVVPLGEMGEVTKKVGQSQGGTLQPLAGLRGLKSNKIAALESESSVSDIAQ